MCLCAAQKRELTQLRELTSGLDAQLHAVHAEASAANEAAATAKRHAELERAARSREEAAENDAALASTVMRVSNEFERRLLSEASVADAWPTGAW